MASELSRNQVAILYLKLVLTALFSGFILIGGRMIANGIPPYSAMFIRFFIASVLMLIIMLKRNELGKFLKLSRKQWITFFALSISGVIAYNWFMLMGLKTVPAARAGIIFGLFPLCTWLAAWLILKERLSRYAMLGSLVCLGGVFLALSQGSSEFLKQLTPNAGDILLFISLLCWVCYALIASYLLKTLDALFVSTAVCSLSVILLFPPAFMEGLPQIIANLSLADSVILLFQGVFSTTLAFLWYSEGMEKLGAGKATLFINIMPLGTVFMAAIMLGEPLFISQIIGAALVCVGVWLAGKQKNEEA